MRELHDEAHDEPHDRPHDEAHDEPHDRPHDEAHDEPHDRLICRYASHASSRGPVSVADTGFRRFRRFQAVAVLGEATFHA
jgi:hypothetical protein